MLSVFKQKNSIFEAGTQGCFFIPQGSTIESIINFSQ